MKTIITICVIIAAIGLGIGVVGMVNSKKSVEVVNDPALNAYCSNMIKNNYMGDVNIYDAWDYLVGLEPRCKNYKLTEKDINYASWRNQCVKTWMSDIKLMGMNPPSTGLDFNTNWDIWVISVGRFECDRDLILTKFQ